MENKNVVTKKEEGKELVDMSMFSGVDSGFEGTSADTFKTPFLKVLQALSPELKKSDPSYVPEAQAGMFFNTATQLCHEKIEVIVLKIEHSILAWRPMRGGFVGRFSKAQESELVAKQVGVEKWDSDDNELMDSIEFFCLNAADPSEIFILPLSKASIKHGKAFATRLRMLKANGKPVNVSWAGVWELSVVEEKNDKGSWYTVGSSPTFKRFITKEERDNFVLPSKEMLRSAETDYKAMDSDAVVADNF
jgi:hypothetical protein